MDEEPEDLPDLPEDLPDLGADPLEEPEAEPEKPEHLQDEAGDLEAGDKPQGQPEEGGAEAPLPGEATSEPVADQFTRGERLREEKKQSRRFARQAAEGDPVGSAASGPLAEADPTGEASSETGPDWEDASSVVPWYGRQVIQLIGVARREKALTRLRALSQAVDTWSKLLRLSCDTAEIQQIKGELAELRHELEAQKGLGPRGVVRQ